MFRASAMKATGRALCVVVAAAACNCRSAPGTLAYSATEASRAGKKAITIRYNPDENGTEGHLDAFLRFYATIVATPADPASVRTTDRYYVYTWRSFRVLRILAHPQSEAAIWCDSSPSPPIDLPRASNGIVIPLVGGSAMIDGVEITMDTDEARAPFKPGQQYLFLATLCPGGVALLTQGRADIFEVTPDGRIAATTPPWHTYMKELLALGTLDRLTEHLKALSVPH